MQLGKIHIFLTGICMFTELSVVVFFLSLGYQTILFIFFFYFHIHFFNFLPVYTVLILGVVCSSIPPSLFPFFALSHDFLFFSYI